VVLALIIGPQLSFADSYNFNLIPADGNVAGPAGSIVGWGYSITNQSSQYWLVTVGLSADPFQHGTPNAIFDFPDLAPGDNATENFDPNGPTGLYELTWDSDAPLGFVNSGMFTLSAQWWTGDPLNGGTYVMDAPDTMQAYSASVSGTSTPEPTSLLLLVSGVSCIAAWTKRTRAR
jgi:hypothetical protein